MTIDIRIEIRPSQIWLPEVNNDWAELIEGNFLESAEGYRWGAKSLKTSYTV